MRTVFVLLALLLVCPAYAADWPRDLDFMVSEIERLHPNPYKTVPRDEFRAAVARLSERSGAMKGSEIVAELSRIVALIRDGHTRLTLPIDSNAGFFLGHTPTVLPPDPTLRLRHLPVRFFWFDDGLFIRDAADARLIGAKVAGIGAVDVTAALEKIAPYVSADNDGQRRLLVADYLAIPEMIAAAGIAPNADRVEVRTEKGTTTLEALTFGTAAEWLDKPDPRPFSFRFLRNERIVHFVYNEVSNDESEMLSDFAARMFRFVDEHPVEALVIDIRQNPGGNGGLNRPLVHGLIRSRKLQDPGRLFVLIGRRTFSAAMFFALDLEQNTNAMFAGEPTGAIPNHFGDSRKVVLPSSGLTVRVSTLYWQKSDPRDKRTAIEPQIPIPVTSAFLQRDVALETTAKIVRAMRKPGKLSGRWSGSVTVDSTRVPIVLENGRVTSKDLGIESAPLTDGRFKARVGEGWMFGAISLEGRSFPFYLTTTFEK